MFPTFVAQTCGPAVSSAAPADRSGDCARFSRVVLPHLDDAFGLARWLTGNRTDAEDVVQEACLRALGGIGGCREDNARAWLMKIVRNTAYTWLARNRPAALVQSGEIGAVDRTCAEFQSGRAAEIETPEAALIAKIDAACVRAALEALPPVYRETLVLREFQGFGYREIADITDVAIGTVMSRLARARRKLIEEFSTASGSQTSSTFS